MPHARASLVADTLTALAQGRSLGIDVAHAVFDVVMRGEATHEEMRALLVGLRDKGESALEIAGAARALRGAMVRVEVADRTHLVDTCGTGGGRVGTVNISTGAAFVVAGAGIPVAKHGNRSFTSRSGSADVLEALGVDIGAPPGRAAAILAHAGLAFLFAPAYHPAMRHLAPVRRELKVPTIMNLVGPLANPALVERQVLGVADAARAPLLAQALASLETRHALVVHAEVGMDEISPVGRTLDDLSGGEPAENAAMLLRALDGEGGAVRDALVLNAAAALYVSGRGWSFGESVDRARAAIDGGAAREALERLRAATQQEPEDGAQGRGPAA